MKLVEILDNILLEMSYPRKKAENKIENLNHAILSHIVCILLIKFDDSQKQYYNHWISEVNSYLFKIDEIRIKPKNKKLPFRRYFELLFNEYADVGLENFVIFVKHRIEEKNMTIKVEEINIEEFYKKLRNIFLEICNLLSSDSSYTKEKLIAILGKI
jgi:hypothetical protein